VKGATKADDDRRKAEMTFQSTLPVKGATTATVTTQIPAKVSIHAPSEGSDQRRAALAEVGELFQSNCFNPRSQ